MDHIQNAVAVSRAQIVNVDVRLILKFLKGLYMAVRQIHHMDIVADAGSVRRIIIVSEYAYLFQLAYRHLGNIGRQVVGDSLRILADHAAFMSAHRVEVAEQDYAPLRIRLLDIR